MKMIGVFTNVLKDENYVFTIKVIKFLNDRGIMPVVLEEMELCESLDYKFKKVDNAFFYSNLEVIVVLGGDGTFLSVASKASKNNINLLGINLGTLGYLTDADKSTAFESLEKLISDEFKIEERAMLEVDCNMSENPIALNDICITKGVNAKLIKSTLKINGQLIGTYKSDGLIISTPTGSTAYNLSAGGPIIKPDTNVIVITHICPHNLFTRPIVVSSDEKIEILVSHRSESEVVLSVDGVVIKQLQDQDTINVFTSKYSTKVIKTVDLSFYDILRLKMHE